MPAVQTRLANIVAETLSNKIQSKVEIKSVTVGLLNRITINDIAIYDLSGEKAVRISRVSANPNLLKLIAGNIDIGTAQLFGTDFRLYKNTIDGELNCQFLLNAFKTDNEQTSDINLHIGSFIVRNSRIRYDVLSEPHKNDQFDTNHINFSNLDAIISLKVFTNDSLNASINRFKILDNYSGVKVHDSSVAIEGNHDFVLIRGLNVKISNSELHNDSLLIYYNNDEVNKYFSIAQSHFGVSLLSNDLSGYVPQLKNIDKRIDFSFDICGDSKGLDINNFILKTNDNSISIEGNAGLSNVLVKGQRAISLGIKNLNILTHDTKEITRILVSNDSINNYISNLNTISYKGNISFDESAGFKSEGDVSTDAGNVTYSVVLDKEKDIELSLNSDELNVGQVLQKDEFGIVRFNMDFVGDIHDKIPIGISNGEIKSFFYKGHDYQNIKFGLESQKNSIWGNVKIEDPSCNLSSDFEYSYASDKSINLKLDVNSLDLKSLNLVDLRENSIIAFNLNTNVEGKDLDNLFGKIELTDFCMHEGGEIYNLKKLIVDGHDNGDGTSIYTVDSDFLNAQLSGEVSLTHIYDCFLNQIHNNLDLLVPLTSQNKAFFDFDISLSDSPILNRFMPFEYSLDSSMKAKGHIDTNKNYMDINVSIPSFTYQGNLYSDVKFDCVSNQASININAKGRSYVEPNTYKEKETTTIFDINAKAIDNIVDANVNLHQQGRNTMSLNIRPQIQFSDSLGSLCTNVRLRPSKSVINDTIWTISPSLVSLYKNEIDCRNVDIHSEGSNSSISINGKASESTRDSLVVKLTNMPVNYVTSAINFHAVEFGGLASGSVYVKNVATNETTDIRAILNVKDFSLQGGSFGDAVINAHWDETVGGVVLNARIVDLFNVPIGFTNLNRTVTGITTVDGYIAPSKSGLFLNINTMNSSAKFLEGFIGSVFEDVTGTITGPVTLIQTAKQFDLLGELVPNLYLHLTPTNMIYHIEKDTIKLMPNLLQLNGATIKDKYGHSAVLNANISHNRLSNWGYDIVGRLNGLCAYDEDEFNSDKFLATLFANGDISIKGSPTIPLTIDATITPAKGSMFAYDASTPDAIIGNSFIEFRDRDSITINQQKPLHNKSTKTQDSIMSVKAAMDNYKSDIRLNFNVTLTPDCEIKLKMDNIEDGYMSTRGYANLNATWYNKGAFQLFGDYNIESGSYRMYLHDLIFRDLMLQNGSKVEFNGNPFDANIHLICNHTINSVPLTDLTSTTSLMQNNKVKVVCVLDITGTLDNMDFKFDMQMPNVSEEVRQVVRSLVSTEEEMNTQALYLLGVGRFFPNEYARVNGNDNSGQAVNSLLSSTISGQINQMLSNMMGRNSNWTLGSSLVTGEKGWEDLDVEGTLSGRMLDDRLLINGNFGYRDNSLINRSTFVGDFEVKWRMARSGKLFIKAYNQTNDRYFTKATLNTQGIGLTWQQDFESLRRRLKEKETTSSNTEK